MADPTARTLRLLSLLQTHRFWTGPELAGRLGVSERTLRRDVDRIRELGYRVDAQPGAAGGYRLESGSQLPPLLLDDDEAVAIAVGLRTAAVSGVADGERTGLSAMAKLEQVLPPHLRRRVAAVQAHTVPTLRAEGRVGAGVLGQLALACRDHERLRFRYTSRSEEVSSRLVEPHSLVPHERRWYFIAWDVGRGDWRTFRIDRMSDLFPTGARFTPKELPADDAAEFVRAAHAAVYRRIEAVVHLEATLEQVREHFGVWASRAVERDDGTVDWPISADNVPELFLGLGWIPEWMGFTVSCDEQVATALHGFAERLRRAV